MCIGRSEVNLQKSVVSLCQVGPGPHAQSAGLVASTFPSVVSLSPVSVLLKVKYWVEVELGVAVVEHVPSIARAQVKPQYYKTPNPSGPTEKHEGPVRWLSR